MIAGAGTGRSTWARGWRASVLLAACACTSAAAAPVLQPERDARIARVFADFDGLDRPGCAVGVMQDGRLIRAAGYGAADLDSRTPIDSRTVFNIGSVSKQFTAFAVLQLGQRGALSLDDSITKFVPELGAYARPVTLRHLLHHVGGLRDYIGLLLLHGYSLGERTTPAQALEALGRQTASNAQPGVEYDYSNTGYFLLALVVERVSGRSLKQYLQDEVFTPLGMADTTVLEHYPADVARLARPYDVAGGRFTLDEWLWEQVGDGQVLTTVEDLARWEANFRTATVGSPALFREMHLPFTLQSGRQVNYGAGVALGQYRGLRTIRHGGDWSGYRAHLMRFPDQGFAVSVLCNRPDAGAFRRAASVAEVFLSPMMTASDVSPFIDDLRRNEPGAGPQQLPPGLYRDPDMAAYLRLERDGADARVEVAGVGSALAAAAPGVYRLSEFDDMFASFVPAADGHPARIVLQDSQQPRRYSFAEAWKPAGLDRYVGTYRSAEADVGYRVILSSGALALETGAGTLPLRPAALDEFEGSGLLEAGEPFTLRFESGTAVDGFELFTTGLRGLRFKRRD